MSVLAALLLVSNLKSEISNHAKSVEAAASRDAGDAQIAAGGYHSFALSKDGVLWGWGANSAGQLGDGTVFDRYVPFRSKPTEGLPFSALAAGEDHVLALGADWCVWACGSKEGTGDEGQRTEEHPKWGKVDGLEHIVAIAAGKNHSMALAKDGMVWEGVRGGRPGYSIKKGLTGVAAIAAGANHSLALKHDGSVWEWMGEDPVRSSLKNVAMLSAGVDFSVALKADGTVWAWGVNEHGQLGNGKRESSTVPVQVKGLSGVRMISCGYEHSTALKSDGTVWAWGDNNMGQLGCEVSGFSTVPVQVSAKEGEKGFLGEVKSIACGGYHTLFLKIDNTIWATGHNFFGQLGNWQTADCTGPVPLAKQCLVGNSRR